MDPVLPPASIHGAAPSFPASTDGVPAGTTILPTYALHSPGQILLATFLGGTVGGAWLLAANFRRLGRGTHAIVAIVLGVLAMAALFALVFATNSSVPRFLWMAELGGMYAIARATQGVELDAHLARSGKKASSWIAAGVGALCFAVTVGAIVGVVLLRMSDKVEFGKAEVYYDDGATEAEARALGQGLADLGALDQDREMSIKVTRSGSHYIVAFVMMDRAFDDAAVKQALRETAKEVSHTVFHDAPVDVFMTDTDEDVKVRLFWQDP